MRKNKIKKTSFKTAAMQSLAGTCIILFLVLIKEKRFNGIAAALILAAAVALCAEFLFLLIFKKQSKARSIFKAAVLLFINLSVFTCLCVYSFAPAIIFYPHFDEQSYKQLQLFDSCEEIDRNMPSGRIGGWFYNNAGDAAPVLLCFYGNGENASTRMLSIMQNGTDAYFDGYNIMLLDYPGYGKSEGFPSDGSLREFALDAYKIASEKSDSISIMGYSIGTGIANYAASRCDVKGLILLAPYANGYDLYNNFVNIFHGRFMRSLVAYKMESCEFAESVKIKPLIIASINDEIINFNSSKRLYESFSSAIFKPVSGLTHDYFWDDVQVFTLVEAYLKGELV